MAATEGAATAEGNEAIFKQFCHETFVLSKVSSPAVTGEYRAAVIAFLKNDDAALAQFFGAADLQSVDQAKLAKFRHTVSYHEYITLYT